MTGGDYRVTGLPRQRRTDITYDFREIQPAILQPALLPIADEAIRKRRLAVGIRLHNNIQHLS